MRAMRSVNDVGSLPTVTWGPRSIMWWGTLGFMTIEGWTTALLVGAYLYLRQNFDSWPPAGTLYPHLGVPSVNLAIMLVSLAPAWLADRSAKRLDLSGVRRWLLISSIIGVVVVVLRWWELWAIGPRWDTNAYGSAAWLIVGFHASLLLLDVADTIGLTLFFFFRDMPAKSFSDTSDNSMYWFFTIGIWIPIYLIVYVGPWI